MYKFISSCCILVLIIGLTACSKDKEQPSTSQQDQAPVAGAPAGLPPAPVTAKVLETMDAAGYTYLNVATDSGEKWIAVNQAVVEVGQEVTFMDGMVMQNFFSKSLDRTFPEIIFSSGLLNTGATPPGIGAGSFSQALSSEGGTGVPEGGSGAPAGGDVATGSKKAVVPFAEIKVEKAAGENSYTVAEIFSKATELNGQTVVVKAKVVKVSPRIMGRNWIHLQDGTGSPEENTHDLVVTTSQEAGADWDIITMEGVIAANKDFGSGYSYPVIIEDASLKE